MMNGFAFFPPLIIPATESGWLGISPDGWVAIFTGCLFFATFIQSGFALRADYLTRRSLKLTREQAATARNAAIAALSAELPYLSFFSPGTLTEVMNNPRRGENPDFVGNVQLPSARSAIIGLAVKNLGRTPAKIIEYRIGFVAAPKLPLTAEYQLVEKGPWDTGVLDHNQTFTLTASPPIFLNLRSETIADVKDGKAHVWVYCRCSYLDHQERKHTRSAIWIWQKGAFQYGFARDETAPASYRFKEDDYSDF